MPRPLFTLKSFHVFMCMSVLFYLLVCMYTTYMQPLKTRGHWEWEVGNRSVSFILKLCILLPHTLLVQVVYELL